ncbi:hypothetical protein T4B_12877 [Trichinella pseudospiralis]|uniref:Uncharacterized protein n=1 Tax=Trichinella pseudospiralis TaxID=6337 RepID=A0A0V1ITN1_TRIPS|nr:hypothetical protein T4B_6219 [Trichinella pseudospiralis]KRZ28141.1 hypothetical protein T4B_12877 [Trichinella pseudospiralis]
MQTNRKYKKNAKTYPLNWAGNTQHLLTAKSIRKTLTLLLFKSTCSTLLDTDSVSRQKFSRNFMTPFENFQKNFERLT